MTKKGLSGSLFILALEILSCHHCRVGICGKCELETSEILELDNKNLKIMLNITEDHTALIAR